MIPDQHIFAGMIRALRERRKLSQKGLAARCAPPRSRAAIAQWESGDHPLSEATLAVAAEAMGFPSMRLFLRAGLRALDRDTTKRGAAPTGGAL